MANLSTILPTLQVLENRIQDSFRVNISDFIARTAERRITVIKNRRYVITAVGVFIFSILALFLSYSYLNGTSLSLATLYLFALSVAATFFNYQWYREQKVMTQELNLALIPVITSCFDRLVLYTHDEVHRKETEAMLRESQLVGESFNVITADDMFSFYEPYPWSMRELELTRQEHTGKESRSHQVFKGVLVEVTLPNSFAGITYISTEGDKHGFSHNSFWAGLSNKDKVTEITLEWNQFERDLHVASNDEVEARYILTPNLMLTLHDWWNEYQENIRIIFKNNKMFMLLPDHGIKIGTSTTSTDSKELEAYALSVIRPIWRTLMLIEDVRI